MSNRKIKESAWSYMISHFVRLSSDWARIELGLSKSVDLASKEELKSEQKKAAHFVHTLQSLSLHFAKLVIQTVIRWKRQGWYWFSANCFTLSSRDHSMRSTPLGLLTEQASIYRRAHSVSAVQRLVIHVRPQESQESQESDYNRFACERSQLQADRSQCGWLCYNAHTPFSIL